MAYRTNKKFLGNEQINVLAQKKPNQADGQCLISFNQSNKVWLKPLRMSFKTPPAGLGPNQEPSTKYKVFSLLLFLPIAGRWPPMGLQHTHTHTHTHPHISHICGCPFGAWWHKSFCTFSAALGASRPPPSPSYIFFLFAEDEVKCEWIWDCSRQVCSFSVSSAPHTWHYSAFNARTPTSDMAKSKSYRKPNPFGREPSASTCLPLILFEGSRSV